MALELKECVYCGGSPDIIEDGASVACNNVKCSTFRLVYSYPQWNARVVRVKPKQSKSDFWKAYEHPLWQKKRLEILERDQYTCLECEAQDQQLHIHHAYYVSGRKPWEYPNWSLTTLCKDCHKQDHEREPDESPIEEWERSIDFFTNGSPAKGNPWLWDVAVEIAMSASEGMNNGEVYGAVVKFLREARRRHKKEGV